MASRQRLYLYDTTLRDGGQTPGIDFSLEDKLSIIRLLDELGLDYIEGGYPGANETDTALFGEPRKMKASFAAFDARPPMTRACRTSCRRSLMPYASSPRPGTITCAWH